VPISMLAGLLLAATTPSTDAGTSAQTGNTITCLTIKAGPWSGTPEERRHIDSTPVPQRLKDDWFPKGCETIDRGSFLEWHLRYGAPGSTAAALNWVETTTLKGIETPNDFRVAAKKDVTENRGGAGAADRARRDLNAFYAYAFLAGQYLRAAEYFHSSELLTKAEPYVVAVNLGLDVFEPSSEMSDWRDFGARYAVEKAYETGSIDDVAAADKLLNQTPGGPRLMKALVDQVRMNGDVCGGGAGSSAPDIAEGLAEACAAEPNLSDRVRRYWRDRAMLDLVGARIATTDRAYDAVSTASELLQQKVLEDGVGSYPSGRTRYTREADEVVGLYLAAADSGIACARHHPGVDDPPCDQGAASYLDAAEAIVSPAENPNRFRQISAAYSQVCRLPLSYAPNLCAVDSEMARQEAYLRIVAAHLDEIDDPSPTRKPEAAP
jgi:hypothetical protein